MKPTTKNALTEFTEALSIWCIELGDIKCAKIEDFKLPVGWTMEEMMTFMQGIGTIDYVLGTEDSEYPGIIWLKNGCWMKREISPEPEVFPFDSARMWERYLCGSAPDIPDELERSSRFIEFYPIPYK